MSIALTISEKTYQLLENQAQKRQLESVEHFLEKLTEQFESEEAVEWEKELERQRSRQKNERISEKNER